VSNLPAAPPVTGMPAIAVTGLSFSYPGAPAPVLRDLSFTLPAGARCLLLGANGVGKSTLLRLLAGKHMLAGDTVRVLGRPAFHDTSLAAAVAFLGGPFPFHQDIRVDAILAHRQGLDRARVARVVEILDVDPGWRMHQVSDGQRRRVQLLLDLIRAPQVILLDEVTADLDVLARADLLRYLTEESQQRAVTVVYASHVLDGLAAWGTHLMFLSPGGVRHFGPLAAVPALAGAPLHLVCEQWMREDRLPGGRLR
jgi:CCR4-NOT complex subunit CAF16